MPEKLGNGGHGPENYDPNTGKYETDGQPNKSYDNPEEENLIEQTKAFESKVKGANFYEQNRLNSAFFKGNSYVRKLALSIGMVEEIVVTDGKRSCFNPYDMMIEITRKEFDKGLPLEICLWHEIFHSFNCARGGKLTDYWKLSNGKTLVETLKEEIQNIDYDKIVDEYQSGYLENVFNRGEVNPQMISDLESKIQDKKNYVEFDGFYEVLESRNAFKQGKITEQELKQIEQNYDNATKELQELEFEKEMKEANLEQCKWIREDGGIGVFALEIACSGIALSDLLSGLTNNQVTLGFRHEDEYWDDVINEEGKNSLIVDELFANFGSAKSRKDELGLSHLKKFIPQTLNGLEELYTALEGIADEIKQFRGE